MKESNFQWPDGVRGWYFVLTCYMLVLSLLSLNPWIRPVSTSGVFSPDKVDHALAYGGLTIILYFCLAGSRNRLSGNAVQGWMAAVLISTLTGAVIEVAQSLFTRNRTGSLEDVISNAIGACIGYLAYQTLKFVQRIWGR